MLLAFLFVPPSLCGLPTDHRSPRFRLLCSHPLSETSLTTGPALSVTESEREEQRCVRKGEDATEVEGGVVVAVGVVH